MAAQPNRYPPLTWRKSSESSSAGECVEVAESDSAVLVRDSRDRSGVTLRFSGPQWRCFTRQVRDRDLEIAAHLR
jgi:hypothetical protein